MVKAAEVEVEVVALMETDIVEDDCGGLTSHESKVEAVDVVHYGPEQKKHSKNSQLTIHFPTNLEVSE